MKVLVSAALVFLAACVASPSGGNPAEGSPDGVADGSGPNERVFGTVEFYDQPVKVVVPSSAQPGQPFAVTVVTYGGGCIEKGGTKVEVEGLRAEVRPYDYDITPVNGVCTDELRIHEHTATLSFEEMGTAEVVFFGRKKGASGTTQTSVTRTLEVR